MSTEIATTNIMPPALLDELLATGETPGFEGAKDFRSLPPYLVLVNKASNFTEFNEDVRDGDVFHNGTGQIIASAVGSKHPKFITIIPCYTISRYKWFMDNGEGADNREGDRLGIFRRDDEIVTSATDDFPYLIPKDSPGTILRQQCTLAALYLPPDGGAPQNVFMSFKKTSLPPLREMMNQGKRLTIQPDPVNRPDMHLSAPSFCFRYILTPKKDTSKKGNQEFSYFTWSVKLDGDPTLPADQEGSAAVPMSGGVFEQAGKWWKMWKEDDEAFESIVFDAADKDTEPEDDVPF